jgi:thiol-disulfide isomerase/thioredoxin
MILKSAAAHCSAPDICRVLAHNTKCYTLMNRILFILLFAFFHAATAHAFNETPPAGHRIKVKLENYPSDSLVLGFHFGDKQYVKDTATLDKDGYFNFNADTLLPCGVYLLVLKPDNAFIQFLVPEDDQDFLLATDAKESVDKMKVKGSEANTIFYDYLRFINERRPMADTVKAQISSTTVPADSAKLAVRLSEIDQSVKDYQQMVLKKYPGSLQAKIIRGSLEPEVPEFTGDEKEVQQKRYLYYRSHFFDNIDLADGCMLRSPILFQKVDFFINKLTPQHPDSISVGIDTVVNRVFKNEETYKFILIYFLNSFAKSTFVGMDAVYVHIAKKYYCSGMAPWTNQEDVEKICDNANRLEPILIGKIAPNITVKDQNNQPVSLWDVDADYTVLFFWDPECGHCKKSAPFMVDFAKKYKEQNVKIFAVCTAITDKAADCWKSAEEKGFSDNLFLNTYDPYLQSKYKTIYDVRSTPQIFVLNRKHEILMKRIGAEQLGEVMEQVMTFQNKK